MKNKKTITLSLLAGLLAVNSAIYANETFSYTGVNILNADDDIVGSAIGAKLYSDYFTTFESSFMLGVEGHLTYLGQPEANGVEYTQFAIGASLLAGYDFDWIKPYGSIGYSYWGAEASTSFSDVRDTGGTLSYGVGAFIPLGDSFALSADYIHFNEIAGSGIDVFSVGIALSF